MDLDIPLSAPQREFVTSKAPNPALVAGLGAGKTYAATIRFVIDMLLDKGINCLLGMPTYDLLRLRAIPGFEEVLEKIGLPFNVNKSDYSIEIIGYGFIYFRSYDRPERWIAFEVAKTLLDELDTLPKDKAALVYRKATERTRQKCKTGNMIGVVTTPDQGYNGFIYQKWVKQKQDGYEIIQAPTSSNPYLPDGYIEQIKANYDPLLAEMYLNGQFVSLNDKKVYHFFNRKSHHTDRELTRDDQFIHVSIDFNIGGCCSVVWLIENNQPIAVDEFVSHDTYDFVNNLAKYKSHKITVYPDASGRSGSTNATVSDVDIIENNGYSVDAPRANPAVRDRINSFNSLFSHDKIKVNTDKCPNLTHALETQGYTDKGDPEKFNEHPAIDDWTDNAGYFINRRFPIAKPVTTITTGFVR